jgi:hypothetical protein
VGLWGGSENSKELGAEQQNNKTLMPWAYPQLADGQICQVLFRLKEANVLTQETSLYL